MATTESTVIINGNGIATKANEVTNLMSGKPYVYGGKNTNGFDCSGFVSYVLGQLYPHSGNSYSTTANGLMTDCGFTAIDAQDKQPGDLIFFLNAANVATHVGIVYDTDHWIGSQTSTGVAKVKFTNPYWSSKPQKFRRIVNTSTTAMNLGRGRFVEGAFA